MLYLAYGSNLDCRQMIERCPTVRFFCVARLDQHRLDFTRRSRSRNCGVADIVAASDTVVWGVVYDLLDSDITSLDTYEGYNSCRADTSYQREERYVFTKYNNQRLAVWTYVANREPNPPKPNAEYKRHIVEGARFWRLPDEYLTMLDLIQTDG